MNNNGIHRKKDSARIVWDSKPRRAPNPKDIEFQTAEVVIPNPETAWQLPMSFRDTLIGEEELDKQKMNRLIWGDNLLAMQALLNQGYEGKINLIYIERLAYKDTWAGGTDSYLDMLYPRLQLMKRLLAPDGSIYVHLDWHVGHYVKVMMDEIFGSENFVNEIIWHHDFGGRPDYFYPRKHDMIFWYTRGDQHTFHKDKLPLLEYRGQLHAEGKEGKTITDVWDIAYENKMAYDNTGYETQKPKELLKRIIEVGSNDNDLIADFFVGSGTTLKVAEMLNRRWIGCELGKVGIQVARARLGG